MDDNTPSKKAQEMLGNVHWVRADADTHEGEEVVILGRSLESDRAELIPPDLAPRITQLVVDDLRAAGWILISPVELRHTTSKDRELLRLISDDARAHAGDDWYANRRDSYRAAKNATP